MDTQAQMEEFNRTMQGRLPGLLGIAFTHLEYGLAVVELHLRPEILNTRGHLHAGTIVSVADTACGGGCWVSLPEGCQGWTTMELKSNLVGSAGEGHVVCEARLRHGGRSTQVWDATVRHAGESRNLAFFSCTQFLIWQD